MRSGAYLLTEMSVCEELEHCQALARSELDVSARPPKVGTSRLDLGGVLSRHVVHRPHPRSALREGAAQFARDAKVGNLDVTRCVDEQVRGLDVAVDGAPLLVQVDESMQHRPRDRAKCRLSKRRARRALRATSIFRECCIMAVRAPGRRRWCCGWLCGRSRKEQRLGPSRPTCSSSSVASMYSSARWTAPSRWKAP